ncbi:MAG: nuclear transport factor 2 family protein [Candidatus Binataceae bacterium]
MAAKSIEQTARELADREAIRELPLKYCDCVWRNDMIGIVELFAADGEFVTKGLKREHRASGHEALRKLYGGITQGPLTPRPYIHNHVIDLAGAGRATGRCYVELRNLKQNMEWVGSGWYADEYVRVGEDWKFKTRTFRTAYMSTMPG